MSKTVEGPHPEGAPPDPLGAPSAPPLLQHQGAAVDDHGRPPGAPSRTGTASTAPPIDPERVREANAQGGHRAGAAEPTGGPRQKYELAFPGGSDGADLVEVTRSSRTGPGGHPVYQDTTGIIQAEINDQLEVRVLDTGRGQDPVTGVMARPLD
ncbi:DUF6296 family protein [Streptomyces xanthophaeus]|uniref:DUF6296 family protein n=1 Tax=Streptomyces xanthophaeus TaxID=67385 RepID=UPI00371B5018